MSTTMTFTLKEPLNRDWRQELIVVDGDFPETSVLRGPDGLVAAQRTPTGLTFVDVLPALSRRRYDVVSRGEHGPPSTDLEVTTGDDCVHVSTSGVAVTFPLGEAVRPPILAMRSADGTELGSARFFGERVISSFRSELVSRGPVVAEVRMRWEYSDGAVVTLSAQVVAGDSRILWDMDVEGDAIDAGWELPLGALGRLLLNGVGGKACESVWGIPRGEIGLADPAIIREGVVLSLSPWADWWDEQAHPHWRFVTADRKPIFSLDAYDPGSWVVPEPIGTHAPWDEMFKKYLPVIRDAEGNLAARVTSPRGRRCWLMGPAGPTVGRELDTVLRQTLKWPDGGEHPHPILYLRDVDLSSRRVPADDHRIQAWLADGGKDLDTPYTYGGVSDGKDTLQNRTDEKAMAAWLLTGSAEVAEQMHLVDRLRRRLARYETKAELDWMRYVPNVVHFYDIVMGSDLLSKQDRLLFRAQMAHLGYLMADPRTWSMERGYCSRNPNMSVAYNLNLGMVACVLPDHPEAPEWMHRALVMVRKFIAQHKGTKGEWSESLHYTHVSTNNIILFAIAARDTGFCDLLEEGDIKQIMTVCAKLHSPPEKRGEADRPESVRAGVRYAGVRGLAPWGRAAITGQSFGHYAQLAKATATSDPAFSRLMQWVYRETGFNESTGNHNFEMYKDVYFDRSLPAEVPDWSSEAFRGAMVMRRRVARPDEHFLLMESGAIFTYACENGGLMLYFDRGIPLSSRFSGGYSERAEQLISRVSKAHARPAEQPANRWSDSGQAQACTFGTLPTLDYAEVEGTTGAPYPFGHDIPPDLPPWPPLIRESTDAGVLHWRRQLLSVRYSLGDEDAGYLAFLDTTQGSEPSEWKLWMLTDKIGTPKEVVDREAFLADAPGNRSTPPRELPGDRFTALGSYGMDLELYIAAPTDTPRHTLRYCRDYGTVKKSLRGFVESHDLLHLQRPDAGHYFVVVFPRRPSEAAPRFETLAGGRVVRVNAEFGRDYVFLSHEPVRIELEDDVEIEGTAASVQLRPDGPVLALGDAGYVRHGEVAIVSDRAASLHVVGDELVIDLSPDRHSQTVTVHAPGQWRVAEAPVDERPVVFEALPTGFHLTAHHHSNRIRMARVR